MVTKRAIAPSAIRYLVGLVTIKSGMNLNEPPHHRQRRKEMKLCKCGHILTEIEIAASEAIAKNSNTPVIYMCRDCWDDYIYHATTGN